jgi:hypothetical protein
MPCHTPRGRLGGRGEGGGGHGWRREERATGVEGGCAAGARGGDGAAEDSQELGRRRRIEAAREALTARKDALNGVRSELRLKRIKPHAPKRPFRFADTHCSAGSWRPFRNALMRKRRQMLILIQD